MLESGSSWQRIDLVALGDTAPVEPTLAGVLYPGKRHVFSGEPESAKTLYAFALGLDVIRDGGTVLHLDFEMFAAPTRQRLREMGATDQDLDRWIHVEPDGPPIDGDIDALLLYNPTLAIVDAAAGAYDALALDDNQRRDVERFARMIVTPLTHANVASIVIDHVVKNAESRGKFAIGSERKIGGVDVHLRFDTVKPLRRGGVGLVKIVVAKDRFGYLPRPLGELHLTSDEISHAITWELREPSAEEQQAAEHDGFRPTVLMERASRALELAGKPLSKTALADTFSGKKTYKMQAIDALLHDGYIGISSSNARALIHVKPFHADEQFPGSPVVPGTVPSNGSLVPTPSRGEPNRGTTNGHPNAKPVPDEELQRLLDDHADIAEVRQ